MKTKTELCPPGCERFDTHDALAARLLCSRTEAGRKLASGSIRPAHCGLTARFFRTADLDKMRAEAVGGVAAWFAKLSTTEQQAILSKFASLKADLEQVKQMVADCKAAEDAKK